MTEASALQRLQEIDIELLRNASTLKKLPQQAKLKQIDLAQKKVAVELKKITGKRKDAEIDICDMNADIAHYKQVRERVLAEAEGKALTHREARDVEEQLTHLDKVTEKCEHQMGPLNENLEKLQLAEGNARKMAERLVAERQNVQASFDEDSKTVRARIIELNRDREAVVAQVSDEVMASYGAARKRFGGLAVETLTGNVPSTCRVKLQPSLYHDLARGPQITECPYCHRILITDDAEAEA
ncbi:zinc ribbon domain-containing protein [Paratractidigestivibacter sp.]|uniref:zinc ribbon domain-containing protein n=1 Tax=Paratractidigestivibacter sp. TaxID=2847316 RepID=UPI002ABDFDA8|nr:C4-type zinc ribbon domain-containing protein [Paratractidigestivibacter sp.]